MGLPHSEGRRPQLGEAKSTMRGGRSPRLHLSRGEEGTRPMRLAKKFAIAAGSLLALVLAGGAFVKF